MGRKRKPDINLTGIGLVLIAIAIVYVAITGGFNLNFNIQNIIPPNIIPTPIPTPSVPLNPPTQYYQYSVQLTVNPDRICVGQFATGELNTNIPNGMCSIFVDIGKGYQLYKNIVLDEDGYYFEANTVGTAGVATFIAVCSDASGNAKISNIDTLVVCSDCTTPIPTPTFVPTPTPSGGGSYPTPTCTPIVPESCDDWVASYGRGDGFCGVLTLSGTCVDSNGVSGIWLNSYHADLWCGGTSKCCYYP